MPKTFQPRDEETIVEHDPTTASSEWDVSLSRPVQIFHRAQIVWRRQFSDGGIFLHSREHLGEFLIVEPSD